MAHWGRESAAARPVVIGQWDTHPGGLGFKSQRAHFTLILCKIYIPHLTRNLIGTVMTAGGYAARLLSSLFVSCELPMKILHAKLTTLPMKNFG